MRRFLLTLALGWVCSGIGLAQAPDTLFISASQTVHLRFASELKYVNLGSRDIVAKIVDGSKDFVAVKARSAFDGVTSMSCLESTGAMHTFLVAYREHPDRLEVDTRSSVTPGPTGSPFFSFSSQSSADGDSPSASFTFEQLTSMKQELYHIGVADYGIEIACEHVLVKDDVLFLVISVKNSSAVSYDLSAPRFAVESKRRTRRGLEYEKAIFPRNSYGLGTIKPGKTEKLAFSFDKISLTRKQVLRIYFYENSGSRNFVLTLGMNDVNKARRLD